MDINRLLTRCGPWRNEKGFGILDALIAAVIAAGTLLYFAASVKGSYQVSRGINSLSSVDQLDEYLAEAITTKMHAFMRRLGGNGTAGDPGTCSNTGTLPAIATLNSSLVPDYFDTMLSSVSTSTFRIWQLVPVGKPPFSVGPSSPGISPYLKLTFPGSGSSGGNQRLMALKRCYATEKGEPTQTVALGKRSDFGRNTGIYFCAAVLPAAGTLSSAGPLALETMGFFGEFFFSERSTAGALPVSLQLPPSVAPPDVMSCNAVIASASLVPRIARFGVINYTFYWVSGATPPIFHQFSGTRVMPDTLTTPY